MALNRLGKYCVITIFSFKGQEVVTWGLMMRRESVTNKKKRKIRNNFAGEKFEILIYACCISSIPINALFTIRLRKVFTQ